MNIFQIIEQYDRIAIFRHVRPDFDAYGSQYGLASIIKELYPQKRIMVPGEKNEKMLLQMNADEFDSFEQVEGALAIVLDVANRDRIDGTIEGYVYTIKIDHHIVVDSFGDLNIEDHTKSSCCQMIAEICKAYLDHKISIKAASYLYLGMTTDSNRFLYDSTNESTFEAAGYLVSCGIDITKIYQSLYMKDLKEIEVQKYILNLYQKQKNVLYYILMQKDLDALGLSRSEGSNYVNLLSNIEGYPIWVAITENIEENNFRVSIRSRQIVINEVAGKYHGGGHAQASGCTIQSLDELPLLLEDLQLAYINSL